MSIEFVNYRGANQSHTADHNGFAVPAIPVLKGKFGSQNSLQASGSHGSQSDLSQTDSNPDLSSSARKLSTQSNPDQQTSRRGSASSAISDKYEINLSLNNFPFLSLNTLFLFIEICRRYGEAVHLNKKENLKRSFNLPRLVKMNILLHAFLPFCHKGSLSM